MRSLAVAEVIDWMDDAWMKKSRGGPKPADGGGVFPRALSTATVQYNMRQVPQRGMAEMLNAYRSNPWLHTCVDIIGRKFGEVPWKLMARPNKTTGKRVPIGKYARFKGDARFRSLKKALDTGELKEIENHPLLDLWERPSPVMSGFCLRDLWCKYHKMQGESFTYKRRDTNGIVYELWILPPTWIYRVPTENMPYFDVSVIGRTMRIAAEDMIWMKHPELLNPYTRGSGQGESLGSYIDTDHYAMEFQKAYFYNDARPNLMIHMKGAAKDTVKDFENRLDNAFRGPLRSHRPFIYDGPQPLDVKEIDLSKGIDAAIPLLKADRDTFLSVFGIPPELAGVLSSSNRATITVAETILARNVTAPQCEFVLDEIDRQLVPEFDQGEGKILLSYDNPVPEDQDFQLTVLAKAPWTADMGEWRELAGLPSRGDKDNFYMVPVGMSPTDDPSKPVIPLAPHKIGDVIKPGQTSNDVMGENGAPEPGSLKDPLSGVGPTTGGAGDDDEEEPPGGGSDDTAAGVGEDGVNGGGSKKKSGDLGITDFYAAISKADDAPSYTRVKDARTKRVIAAVKPKAINTQIDPVWQAKVKEWGDRAFEDMGVNPAFDMYNETVKDHLEDFSSDRITWVNDTTRDSIASALGKGIDAGEGIEDLSQRIKDVFAGCDSTRAKLIARTEVTRSANFASLQGYKQTGLVSMKKWLATMDDKVRDDHAELGEQEPIPIDDDFEVGDYKGQAPGDFDAPEQDCNCRCSITPVADEAPGVQPEELEGDDDTESKGMRRMTDEARWKRFDSDATSWEKSAVKALRKAFAEQERAALAALRA
jgi:SPP1 gp7 family putative phage head morphogenesis protein